MNDPIATEDTIVQGRYPEIISEDESRGFVKSGEKYICCNLGLNDAGTSYLAKWNIRN